MRASRWLTVVGAVIAACGLSAAGASACVINGFGASGGSGGVVNPGDRRWMATGWLLSHPDGLANASRRPRSVTRWPRPTRVRLTVTSRVRPASVTAVASLPLAPAGPVAPGGPVAGGGGGGPGESLLLRR